MSTSSSNSSSDDSRNLLRSLLQEPSEISTHRPKQVTTSESYHRPPASHQPVYQPVHTAHAYNIPQHYHSIPSRPVVKYHYSFYSPCPMYILFNRFKKESEEFDYDAYLPQSDLFYLRESKSSGPYETEKKRRAEEEEKNRREPLY
ncbi:unnamed protein product [Caenorhabditis brenneri]